MFSRIVLISSSVSKSRAVVHIHRDSFLLPPEICDNHLPGHGTNVFPSDSSVMLTKIRRFTMKLILTNLDGVRTKFGDSPERSITLLGPEIMRHKCGFPGSDRHTIRNGPPFQRVIGKSSQNSVQDCIPVSITDLFNLTGPGPLGGMSPSPPRAAHPDNHMET